MNSLSTFAMITPDRTIQRVCSLSSERDVCATIVSAAKRLARYVGSKTDPRALEITSRFRDDASASERLLTAANVDLAFGLDPSEAKSNKSHVTDNDTTCHIKIVIPITDILTDILTMS